MEKSSPQGTVRIMLLLTVFSLVIVAVSSENTTIKPRSIYPTDPEGQSDLPQTSKWSSVPTVLSGFTTVTIDQLATGSVSLDTTVWKWKYSWNWVTILQFIISLTGILGNLLVVVVMGVRKSASSSTDIFFGALAISDFLTSIFNIPIPRALQVPASLLGSLYCSIISTSCLSWICVISSSYILVGASFERLAAVVYPLRIKEIFTNRRVYIFIIITWFFSVLSSFYYFLSVLFTPDRIYCAPSESDTLGLKIITLLNFTIRLLIPCVLMMISQIAMAISLHQQSRQLREAMSHGSKQSYHILARNRIFKTMLVVIIIYVLCWAPSQITFIVVSFGGSAEAYVRGATRQILNLITFINSSVNPFIYAAHYPKFRSAIKGILVGKTQKNVPLFGVESNQSYSHDVNTDDLA